MGFSLSTKEFIFLCFAAGAKRVYGIEDAFKNGKTSEIFSEIRKVHRSLEEKNYVESDFDGNSAVSKKILKTIQCCANCSSAVLFNASANKDVKAINYYLNKNGAAKLQKTSGHYILSDFDKNGIVSDVLKNLSILSNAQFVEDFEVVILQKELEEIKNDLLSGNKDVARSKLADRVTDSVLSVLLSALEEKENFCALTVIKAAGSGEAECKMIIDSEHGILVVQPYVMNLRRAVKISTGSLNDVINALKQMLEQIVE